jgi:protein PhnA
MIRVTSMGLKSLPDLNEFFSTFLADLDADSDDTGIRSFLAAVSVDRRARVADQARRLLLETPLPLEEIGIASNRWFGEDTEAREWLERVISLLQVSDHSAGGAIVVKDSNGTILHEGDSVTVIKDLKVKGGSSDLKRGTMIKKIHLVGDPEAIECRVDGSTLVLKTCFLKKA